MQGGEAEPVGMPWLQPVYWTPGHPIIIQFCLNNHMSKQHDKPSLPYLAPTGCQPSVFFVYIIHIPTETFLLRFAETLNMFDMKVWGVFLLFFSGLKENISKSQTEKSFWPSNLCHFVWETHGATYVTAIEKLAPQKWIDKISFPFPSATLCWTGRCIFPIPTRLSYQGVTSYRHCLLHIVSQRL